MQLLLILSIDLNGAAASPSFKINNYLMQPTGNYAVGFQDFHWINLHNCPDFNYSDKTKEDFSRHNTKHCHEIMTRIYFPTVGKSSDNNLYYPPIINDLKQEIIKQDGNRRVVGIKDLSNLKSFSRKDASIVNGKLFPVLLFSPGFGCPAELYENMITELVSHGYIVVGINTPFINLVELPNGHVVKPAILANRKEAGRKFLPLQLQDLAYVFQQLPLLHHSNPVFSAMDLEHVGAFGHSVGAKSLAKIAQEHSDWFHAVVTLDIASYEAHEPIRSFSIPVMHVISAYWEYYFNWPLEFKLGKNGFLVLLSPSKQNRHYSYHMNYSDLSTMQYLPV